MKILVVDDHALIREALRGILRELTEEADVVEAPDAGRAMQRIAEIPELELVLLDLGLPDRSGFDLLAELRESHPAMSVVVLSASLDRDDIARALNLGALGFIPKSASREVMLSAFKLVFSGGIYVPPEILARQAAAPAPAPVAAAPASPPQSPAEIGLTGRQMQVL
ncbi:MAG TPA: response regulator transcription factor, partial [Afifellaceae bacterium]|nr:response regulator transcription factor [Afifellaceae bacterium]